jgi:hypothetical protein
MKKQGKEGNGLNGGGSERASARNDLTPGGGEEEVAWRARERREETAAFPAWTWIGVSGLGG